MRDRFVFNSTPPDADFKGVQVQLGIALTMLGDLLELSLALEVLACRRGRFDCHCDHDTLELGLEMGVRGGLGLAGRSDIGATTH